MTYEVVNGPAGMQPIADTSTVQNHKIGTRVQAWDPDYGVGEFIYLKGLASTALGELVVYEEYANVTVRAVAGSRGPAAVAMSANVADQYGWYQIFGAAKIKAGTVADNGDVYLTATAGTVDDAVVAGDKVDGARFKSADGTPAAGYAVCQIAYPSCNGNDLIV